MGMQADVYIPAINGTDGVFLAARLDRGGSDVASASGIFCFIFPRSGTFKVTADLGKLLLNLISVSLIFQLRNFSFMCRFPWSLTVNK